MLDVQWCRQQFPALARTVNGKPLVYFDGPAGSQTPQRVADAVSRYMLETNANHGGAFTTSHESDAILAEAHQAVADLLGAGDPGTVVFGPNMTTLTFALSRSLARTWKAGDEVIVTHLDHDANVSPWVLAAKDAGARVKFVGIKKDDCTLDLEALQAAITPQTRLVAVACASNAVGSINPVKQIAEWTHAVGARLFLDAVHYAPHAAMDVTDWDCDFLACSAYKFFGPHIGILYGKREHLESLSPYKLRPVPESIPDRWMTGTQNHEGIAGTLAAVQYLEELGRPSRPDAGNRRASLLAAYDAITTHERELAEKLIQGLSDIKEIKVYGITDPSRSDERVPTVCFTHVRQPSYEAACHLNRHGIFVWHGNYYALELTETLDVEPQGMVRVGLLHYNTADEVNRLLNAVREL